MTKKLSRYFSLVLFLLAAGAVSAQTLSVIHSFDDGTVPGTGRNPAASLVQGSDGNFYGTTFNGGTAGAGTVFKVTPSGAETVLYNFQGQPHDGSGPGALVLGSDGDFYGTTYYGGPVGAGTMFKITPGGSETVLHGFGMVAADGVGPLNLVLGRDGNFYGMTQVGGTGTGITIGNFSGGGTVFKITPTGVITTLHDFQGQPSDGSTPTSTLILGNDGSFYGTTYNGGSNGQGTVFKMNPTGSETILHNFKDGSVPNDGSRPRTLVLGSDGNFYGVTERGGYSLAEDGTVFKMTPGGTETILHNFGDGSVINDGNDPQGPLIQGHDGNFYGITFSGGSANNGTVFKITPSGTETVLYGFHGQPSDGASPNPLVLGSDGNFYGVTYQGGLGNDGGHGVVFKITPTGSETVLDAFGAGTGPGDGATPQSALIFGGDGNFYGTTYSGGIANEGTVFKITPAGTETVLHSFGTMTGDGSNPAAALVLGNDGNLYGTTTLGGLDGAGTVFKMTHSGVETVLYNFGTVAYDGASPVAALVLGNDGSFYGTTQGGGVIGGGTVFKITPAGIETVLHSFETGAYDGAGPMSGLVLGPDGNFYGTTYYGGTTNVGDYYGSGTVFKITPTGTETVVHSFSDGSVINDGYSPAAPLVVGRDGELYGTTADTVFKITTTGTETTLYTFGFAADDGSNPAGPLVLGNDGNFYGTMSSGGNGYVGVIFEVTPTGLETVVHTFQDQSVPNDGAEPAAGLLLGRDGSFYGTTSFGGADDAGTAFRFAPSATLTWNGRNVAAAPDGTARILWDRADGAAGVWSLSAANVQTVVGPAYGPYQDSQGNWTAQSVKVAGDGTARLLWTRSDGAAGLWSLSVADTQTVVGPVYGPYAGWTASDLATASDGTSHLLWTRSDGAASVWTMNASGSQILAGPIYGPFPGWTAKAVGAAGDGTARVLWSRSDGAAGLWTLDARDIETTIGATYGPYTDNFGTWSASALGTSVDGSSQVLWARSDTAAGMWTFSVADSAVSAGPVYGPFPGFTASTMDAVNGQARVLWVRSDRAAGVWTFGANDVKTIVGQTYGPY